MAKFIAAVALAILWLRPADAVADAPTEEHFQRDGFFFGFALGPTLLAATNEFEEFSGAGGGASVRLGTAATSDLLWLVQVDAAGYLFKTITGETTTNQNVLISLGGQYYVRQAVWVKGAVGLATYRRTVTGGRAIDDSHRGIGTLAGVGWDVVQRGVFALDLEADVNFSRFSDATIFEGGLAVAAHWY